MVKRERHQNVSRRYCSCCFQHKSGNRQQENAWQHVSSTLNALEACVVTSRPVRVRLTHLIRTFLVKNSADKKLSGQVGEQLIECHILL